MLHAVRQFIELGARHSAGQLQIRLGPALSRQEALRVSLGAPLARRRRYGPPTIQVGAYLPKSSATTQNLGCDTVVLSWFARLSWIFSNVDCAVSASMF